MSDPSETAVPLSRSGLPIDFVTHPRPPAAQALGSEIVDFDPETGAVEVHYDAPDTFTTGRGALQGGFVAAMLDDVISLPVLAKSRRTLGPATLDLMVSYFQPVRPGRLYGRARILRWGSSIAFLEAELSDPAGMLLATARATVKLRKIPQEGARDGAA